MAGSVRKKNGRWYYSFELATVDGKRKRVERAGGRTKKEAEKKLLLAMVEYENAGRVLEESNYSVSDYLDYWYENYVLINLKYNTQVGYRNIIRNHLKPTIGKYKLKSLTPAILQELLNLKFKEGLSRSSLTGIKNVLCKSLRMAVVPYQLIKEEPTRYLELPRYDEIKKVEELKIITLDQFKQILKRYPKGSAYYIPCQIAFYTGMRASEVAGLTWDCINLEKQSITVEKTLLYKEGGLNEFGTPKTKASYRTITISDHLTKLLKEHKIQQKQNKLKYGINYLNSEVEFVCTWENGRFLSTNSFKTLSNVVNKELGINFNFHSFRHTHASTLLTSGANIKAISERLGHTNIATTMDIYSHITKELEDQTKSILDSLAKVE